MVKFVAELHINGERRFGGDRRNSLPFGAQGPWLTKDGTLIYTDRRIIERRVAIKQHSYAQY